MKTDIIRKSRRNFLKNTLIGAAGISSLSLLSSCTSFDDYLFEDRYAFNEEVMIVGGGISGLYLAHKLRENKTEFRLFEGSNYFGGRIRSFSGSDYGASLLSTRDKLANLLVKDLALGVKYVDKENFYLMDGMQSLPDALLERIIGLIPYRNFRLRWKLVEIRRRSSGFEVVFENPSGQKRFDCKKIALAIPPNQWSSVTGLLKLPEMKWAPEWLSSLKSENSIKLILPQGVLTDSAKALVNLDFEGLHIRQIIKKNKAYSVAELEVSYPSDKNISIEYVYNALKRKMNLNYPFEKMTGDQYFDWSQVKLIKSSKFINSQKIPDSESNNFQIIGDFTASSPINTIEGALQSAVRASELLL